MSGIGGMTLLLIQDSARTSVDSRTDGKYNNADLKSTFYRTQKLTEILSIPNSYGIFVFERLTLFVDEKFEAAGKRNDEYIQAIPVKVLKNIALCVRTS